MFIVSLTMRALGSLVAKTAAIVGTTALVKKAVGSSCKNTCNCCTNCQNHNVRRDEDDKHKK